LRADGSSGRAAREVRIRYVLPEDADKPKRQTYQLFVDDLTVAERQRRRTRWR
jgi:hypothetical protein